METTRRLIAVALTGIGGALAMTLAVPLLALGMRDEAQEQTVLGALDPIAAAAYTNAAAAAAELVPGCEIPAWILAGIGQVESGHGTLGGSTIQPNGGVEPPVIGPPLPHLGPDTDNGQWDHNPTLDHAIGPMQFIPTTWRHYAHDANNDGVADPHNIHDATLAAAVLLCDTAHPMATEADWRRGLHAYNHSTTYVQAVLDAGATHRAPQHGLVIVPGIGPTSAIWADQIKAMLDHAKRDGIVLTGTSYRSVAEQIELRRAHCGTTDYAIHHMPASQCSPPTARPGTSNHEQGLAIDFHHCNTTSTPCHRWLTRHANTYGIRPLPREPWHWSHDGH